MLPVDIKKIEGYSKISDLIPEGNFLRYTEVWSVTFTHFLDEVGDVKQRIVIELCEDLNGYDKLTIQIIMDEPWNINLCPNDQILGLTIEDFTLQGYEKPNLRLYDYEMSNS